MYLNDLFLSCISTNEPTEQNVEKMTSIERFIKHLKKSLLFWCGYVYVFLRIRPSVSARLASVPQPSYLLAHLRMYSCI